MRPQERKQLLEDVAAMVAGGELDFGDATRLLRTVVLELDRQSFSRAVGISERALRVLEESKNANPTLQTLTRVFSPFGAKIGLIFPRMTEAEPVADETRRRRQQLVDTLRTSRRRGPISRK
jgi:hypothetical protein